MAPGSSSRAAVDDLAQVVGGQLLGRPADAGHAVHLVEEQDQAAVGERADDLHQRAQHAEGVGPGDLAGHAHIAQELGVVGVVERPSASASAVLAFFLLADQRLEVGKDGVFVGQAVDRGQFQRVHQAHVVGMARRLQAQIGPPTKRRKRAFQKAGQPLLIADRFVLFVPDQIAGHGGVDQPLIVVGRLDRAEIDFADGKAAAPRPVAQAVEEVRFAAAVVADHHLVSRRRHPEDRRRDSSRPAR
jgi:hypothetical protein